MEEGAQLRAQFGRVGMFMDAHGVLDRRVEKFLLGIRRQRDGAIHLAGKLAAIDVFASHGAILMK